MSPFELALGIQTKQPMDLTIPRTKDTCCEGVKDVKKMAKDHEENHKLLSFLKMCRRIMINKSTNCEDILSLRWGT